MNLGFDSSKRKVSLGGRSRGAESREDVLRRTHAERQRRARERAEVKSAVYIQAAWRRAAASRRHKKRVREEWLTLYGANLQGAATGADAGAVLRSLLYFLDPESPADVSRLAAFAHHLLSDSGHPGVLERAAEAERSAAKGHVLRLARLVALCLRSLRCNRSCILPETAGPRTPPELRGAGSVLLLVVVRCTDPQLWRKAGASGPALLAELLSLLRTRSNLSDVAHVLQAACRATEAAAAGSGKSRPAGSAPTATALGALVGRLLATQSRGPASHGWLTPLLCVPFLWDRCPGLRPAAHAAWLAELSSGASVTPSLPADLGNGTAGAATALLGNLAEAAVLLPAGPSAADADIDAALAFTEIAARLLLEAPCSLLFPKASIEDDELGDVEMADATATGASPSVPWDEAQMPLARAAKQLKRLASSAAVRALARVLLPAAGPRGAVREAERRGSALCALLGALLAVPGLRDDARLALAVTPDVVPALWHTCLKDRFQAGKWVGVDDSSEAGFALPLLILSQCFSTFLSTTGEAAFYEQQRPLAHSELYSVEGGLLGLLKYALWQILWVDQTRGRPAPPPDVAETRDAVGVAAARLLGQLYDRNCRRRFAPPEAFYAPHLSEELFGAEVQSSLARGAFLEARRTRVWSVLRQAPFLVPFQVRAAVFQDVVGSDKGWSRAQSAFRQPAPIIIRRDRIFWDSFDALNGVGKALKDRLQIAFVDVHGIQEAGVDGGGLFKDLMENLVKEGFDPRLGLFLATEGNRLYPNPSAATAVDGATAAFEFLGRMVGKAMYEGIIVELPLAPFFLKQLLRRGVDVNDLPTLDPELYRNLMLLQSYAGDVEDLSLTFTLTSDVYGDKQERELVRGGKDIPVTAANRTEYILRTANYRLNVEMRPFTDAFRRGLYDVIEPEWVSMFNEEELQMLIRGRGSAGIDVAELQQFVNYAGGYNADHPTIRAFWQALSGFTPHQQASWLKFVTACSRAPLLGFKYLSPPLCIAKAGAESDPASQDRLPTSATCLNLLKLPPMRSPQQIATKLLYAIENVAGFDLS